MGHWFKHDSDARKDEKLTTLKAMLGKSAICDWWDLCEILASKADAKYPKKYIAGLKQELSLTQEELDNFIKTLLDLELLQSDGEFIYSESMIERLREYEERKAKDRQRKSKGVPTEKDRKDGGIVADASYSNSISNSRSLDLNNKIVDERSSINHKTASTDYKLLIDEILLENAKLDYARTDGLQADDVELGFKYLEGHFGKPEKLHQSTSRAQYTALVTWVKQEVLEEKTKVARLKKATDPPKSFKQKTGEQKFQERTEEIFNL